MASNGTSHHDTSSYQHSSNVNSTIMHDLLSIVQGMLKGTTSIYPQPSSSKETTKCWKIDALTFTVTIVYDGEHVIPQDFQQEITDELQSNVMTPEKSQTETSYTLNHAQVGSDKNMKMQVTRLDVDKFHAESGSSTYIHQDTGFEYPLDQTSSSIESHQDLSFPGSGNVSEDINVPVEAVLGSSATETFETELVFPVKTEPEEDEQQCQLFESGNVSENMMVPVEEVVNSRDTRTFKPDMVLPIKTKAVDEQQFHFLATTNSLANSSSCFISQHQRSFDCPYCDKRFSKLNNLKQHIRTHTGEKPFACRYCGKTFCQRTGVMYHERLHTGEKPFSCPQCRKMFVQKSNLTRHMTIHNTYEDKYCE